MVAAWCGVIAAPCKDVLPVHIPHIGQPRAAPPAALGVANAEVSLRTCRWRDNLLSMNQSVKQVQTHCERNAQSQTTCVAYLVPLPQLQA
jgi:hypothetical protein